MIFLYNEWQFVWILRDGFACPLHSFCLWIHLLKYIDFWWYAHIRCPISQGEYATLFLPFLIRREFLQVFCLWFFVLSRLGNYRWLSLYRFPFLVNICIQLFFFLFLSLLYWVVRYYALWLRINELKRYVHLTIWAKFDFLYAISNAIYVLWYH